MRVAGPVTYRVEVSPEGPDRFAANNRFETSTIVPGRPAVLYVEGAEGRGTYLARALTAADFPHIANEATHGRRADDYHAKRLDGQSQLRGATRALHGRDAGGRGFGRRLADRLRSR